MTDIADAPSYNSIVNIDEHTKLLIHGDKIEDVSSSKNAITNTGVIVSSDQGKIGNSSLYFNGSSYLTLPDLDIPQGTGDFTIEWWEYRTASSMGGAFHRNNTKSSGYGFLLGFVNGSVIQAYMSSGSSSWNIASGITMNSLVLNQWVHYAVVRSGNSIMIFVNGGLQNTITTSSGFSLTQPPEIGRYDESVTTGSAFYFTGYIDEFRITDNAVYTSNFTPPTEPYVSSIGKGKIDGSYRNISKAYAKINGAWKPINKRLGKKDNNWSNLK